MPKRSSYEVKKKILIILKDKPTTFADLERKVNTGYRTIKNNCEELKDFGQVNIILMDKHPTNGKKAHIVEITKRGTEFLKKQKEN